MLFLNSGDFKTCKSIKTSVSKTWLQNNNFSIIYGKVKVKKAWIFFLMEISISNINLKHLQNVVENKERDFNFLLNEIEFCFYIVKFCKRLACGNYFYLCSYEVTSLQKLRYCQHSYIIYLLNKYTRSEAWRLDKKKSL